MSKAAELFKDMGAPDGPCYAAMVCGHCATGEVQKALQHFRAMRQEGLVPDGSLFDALLGSCVSSNLPALLEQVLVDMESDGIKPSSATLAVLLRHHGRGGELSTALKL